MQLCLAFVSADTHFGDPATILGSITFHIREQGTSMTTWSDQETPDETQVGPCSALKTHRTRWAGEDLPSRHPSFLCVSLHH